MEHAEWGFLLDENIDRDAAVALRSEGHRAELVVDVLEPGVADEDDVLPFARRNDLVVVTKDVSDFGALDGTAHEGIVLVFDHGLGADDIATGVRAIATAYPSRDAFRGREVLDDWL